MPKPTILYEDENMIVINKPSGLIVHPDGKNPGYTLCDWLLEKYPDIKDVGEPLELHDGTLIPRPGIVHRLDRETTGVMVVAKTQEGFYHLKNQFKNRKIIKIYHAFVYGNLKEERKTIDWPIGRSKGSVRKWTTEQFARGKIREALTQVKVLDRIKAEDGSTVTFIEARPLTGRTHQIRVHMTSAYHPLICDRLYASKKPCLLGFSRMALHAKELILKDVNNKELKITAPYPADFREVLEKRDSASHKDFHSLK